MSLCLAVVLIAQMRVIDNTREPWASVMSAMQANDFTAARVTLEAYGRGALGAPWERAHAYLQAGDLARRTRDIPDARRDYALATATDPMGFDGRMAVEHLGELALDQRQWSAAERTLVRVENDPDPVIHAYAAARLHAVRDHLQRRVRRWGSIVWLAVCAVGLGVRVAVALRAIGWRRASRSMGSALLLSEAVAITGGVVVPRWINLLAGPGWMAFALPAGVVVAVMWATRGGSPGQPRWRRALPWLALALAMACGLYLALEFTWWSVDDPLA